MLCLARSLPRRPSLCVTPETRSQTTYDNSQAPSVLPGGMQLPSWMDGLHSAVIRYCALMQWRLPGRGELKYGPGPMRIRAIGRMWDIVSLVWACLAIAVCLGSKKRFANSVLVYSRSDGSRVV